MKNKLLLFILLSSIFIIKAQAQDVKLITVNQLENRFKQGKDTIYVVNFWATWCKPCVNELPEFEKFKTANKGKPIKVPTLNLNWKMGWSHL
jgi:thiol-disulfide isomerase/thioredoxin